jgi:hypothetical protein
MQILPLLKRRDVKDSGLNMVLSKTKKSVTTGNTTFFIPVFEHGLISVELINNQSIKMAMRERGTRHTWAQGGDYTTVT